MNRDTIALMQNVSRNLRIFFDKLPAEIFTPHIINNLRYLVFMFFNNKEKFMSNCNCVSLTDRWNNVTAGMSPFSSEKSFAAQVVSAVSESNHLNPANQGQQSPVCCRKAVRAVARFIVAAVGTFFASIIGTIYHSIKGALHLALALGNHSASKLHSSCCSSKMRYGDRADEHLVKAGLHGQAAAVDAFSFLGDVLGFGASVVGRGVLASTSEGCAALSYHYVLLASDKADGLAIDNRLMQRV